MRLLDWPAPPIRMRFGRLLGLSLIGGACLSAGPTAARSLSVVDLLDRYAGGQFDTVVEELARVTNFDDLLRQLNATRPPGSTPRGLPTASAASSSPPPSRSRRRAPTNGTSGCGLIQPPMTGSPNAANTSL